MCLYSCILVVGLQVRDLILRNGFTYPFPNRRHLRGRQEDGQQIIKWKKTTWNWKKGPCILHVLQYLVDYSVPK